MIVFGGHSTFKKLNDVYAFNISGCRWIKLSVSGDIPPAKFGHSQNMIRSTMLVVFGGAPAVGIQTHDVYTLDLGKKVLIKL